MGCEALIAGSDNFIQLRALTNTASGAIVTGGTVTFSLWTQDENGSNDTPLLTGETMPETTIPGTYVGFIQETVPLVPGSAVNYQITADAGGGLIRLFSGSLPVTA